MKAIPSIGAAALLLAVGCIENGTRPDGPIEFTRITPNGTPVYHSGMLEPLRIAVFDEAKFAEYWNQAFPSNDPGAALPKVDFSREFVVVTALGERSSGGYGVEVAAAAGAAGEVTVGVTTEVPGKDCEVTLATTQPVDFVKLARPSPGATPVRFVEKTVVKNCGP